MKKGQFILLGICTVSLCIVFGIFLGRNIPNSYIQPSQYLAIETEPSVAAEMTQTNNAEEGLLDLNTASKIQIMELPGIGEVLAQRILDYREAQGAFSTIEDLMNVEGIGEKKIEQIKPFVRIGG